MAVSKAASVRLRRVLRAGGITPTPERVQRLGDLAQWSIDQAILASLPRRRPPAPKPRGRPKNRNMRQLVANLAMFWLDETGTLPAWTYDWLNDAYSGRFVRFIRAFAEELVDDARILSSDARLPAGGVESLATSLADLAANPVRVKTWLKAAGVPKLKRVAASSE